MESYIELLERTDQKAQGKRQYLYKGRCTFNGCGKIVLVRSDHVRSGRLKSCGCYQSYQTTKRNKETASRGGASSHPLFKHWSHMHYRCYTSKERQHASYKKKGVIVCERWHKDNPDGFKNFVKDMGPKPTPKHSIDRINNMGNYEPDNCRWATQAVQTANRDHVHGMSYTPIWIKWTKAKNRNALCEEWAADFRVFYAAVGDLPWEGARLTRPNTNLPMGPDNYGWEV